MLKVVHDSGQNGNEPGKAQPGTRSQGDSWSDDLARVASHRDRAAFARLFNHFAPLLKAFALNGSGISASYAEELVQEVMLKVWQKAAAYDPDKAAASTWIYTIARNSRTDFYRRLNKFDTPLAAEDVHFDNDSEQPLATLQQRRNGERVRSLMAELPREQAQIIAKVYMEGKSHSQVAGELDLPLGTVKSRVRLALRKLQVALGG